MSKTPIIEETEPPPRLKNRQLEVTKSQSRLEPVPHAPNPNLLNPPTRPTTPITREVSVSSRQGTPRRIVRPTLDEEVKRLAKTFKGCSTLDAYETGVKLGEGTFGYVS